MVTIADIKNALRDLVAEADQQPIRATLVVAYDDRGRLESVDISFDYPFGMIPIETEASTERLTQPPARKAER